MRRRTVLLAILLLILLVAANWQPRVIVRAADAPSLTAEHQQQLAEQLEQALPNRDVKVMVILSDRVVATRAPQGVILSRADGEGSAPSGAARDRYGSFVVSATQDDTAIRPSPSAGSVAAR
ncbi:MAG TPA: hypothetical protein VJ276_05370 [Thermoanaerobaculia bacterium]|nr:hypothetical protein [Thermoanaerobaculia bacterium]